MKFLSFWALMPWLCFTGLQQLYGQTLSEPLASSASSYEYTLSLYNRAVKSQSLIYNGPEYNEPNLPTKGHPYFINDFMEEGSVNYEGELYDEIPLLYDLIKDRVIIEHYDQSGRGVQLELHADRIVEFSLYGHRFRRISADSTNNVRSGFYDVLYDGPIKVLAKRRKKVNESVTNDGVELQYKSNDQHLIFYNGSYYYVNGKAGLLKVLKDKKKDLSQYIKKSQVDFGADKEGAIVKVVQYYDSLK